MGGMNYHVTIVFDDGVEWIARIRRHNYTSPPKASRDLTIQSEVATLKFLEKVAVPTPKVYDFALEDHKDNTVGVGYILMEKMPGKLLRWPDLDEMQREKIMKQLADVFVELHRHPFDMLGSLHETVNDGIQVGSLANEAFTDFPTTTEMHPLGPFNSLKDFDTAYLKLTMDLILRGELYTTRHALDGYLIHRHLLDLIPHTPAPAEDKEKFYLKHPDDKGDHILVDDDLNITAIIDWEWALTTPPAHAFKSPLVLVSPLQLYSGDTSPCEAEQVFARILKEKGRQDLAGYVRNGRSYHFLRFCGGYDLDADWDGFLGLFRGLRDTSGVDAGMDWEEWKDVALERYKDDEDLKTLLARRSEPPVSE